MWYTNNLSCKIKYCYTISFYKIHIVWQYVVWQIWLYTYMLSRTLVQLLEVTPTFMQYSTDPGHRNHFLDPASEFLSTHWWSQNLVCQRCFYKPLKNCHPTSRYLKYRPQKNFYIEISCWIFQEILCWYFRTFYDFWEISCIFKKFNVDFQLDFMFFWEILCWRSFYKSLRNCPNRCQRVSNSSVKRPAQFQPAVSFCQFLCPGSVL